jgi:GntR family transcriptional regulator
MIVTVDLDSAVPIYQQLRDRVVEAIAAGELRSGDPLPSTRALAADLAVNFHTVNKAYDLLKQEGVIRVNRKSGAVIRRDATTGPPEAPFVDDWEERVRVLLAEATVQGMDRQDVLRRIEALLNGFEEGA